MTTTFSEKRLEYSVSWDGGMPNAGDLSGQNGGDLNVRQDGDFNGSGLEDGDLEGIDFIDEDTILDNNITGIIQVS